MAHTTDHEERYFPVISGSPPIQGSLFPLLQPTNEAIRQIFTNIYSLEGRTGDTHLLSSVIVDKNVTIKGLTASRLVATDVNKKLVSTNLSTWIAAGAGISVANDGDGTITVTATGGGGGAVDSITGTTNQVLVNGGVGPATGNITLSAPQNIHTGASPTFVGLTLSGLAEGSVIFAGVGGLISQDNSNFFWDNSQDFLGVGGAPAYRIHAKGSGAPNHSIYSSSSDTSLARFGLENSSQHWSISNYGTAATPSHGFVVGNETGGTAVLTLVAAATGGDVQAGEHRFGHLLNPALVDDYVNTNAASGPTAKNAFHFQYAGVFKQTSGATDSIPYWNVYGQTTPTTPGNGVGTLVHINNIHTFTPRVFGAGAGESGQFGAVFQIAGASSGTAGKFRLALYGGASSGTNSDQVAGVNGLASRLAGGTVGHTIGVEANINNLLSDWAGHTGASWAISGGGSYFCTGLVVATGPNKKPRSYISCYTPGSNLKPQFGLEIGWRDGDTQEWTDSVGGRPNTRVGVIIRQPENGADGYVLARFTDTGPTGNALRVVNAAMTSTLYQIDMAGGFVSQGNARIAGGLIVGSTVAPVSGQLGIAISPENLFHVAGTSASVGTTQGIFEGKETGWGAGIEFSSRTSAGGTLLSMAKIVADGENLWNTTVSTQDSRLGFFTRTDGVLIEAARFDSLQRFRGIDGTAGAPFYSFINDSDTGIYSPTTDQWAVATGGASRVIVTSGALQPAVDNAMDLGTSGVYWAKGWLREVQMTEIADPAAPAANLAVLYTRDNGSGKTQLCVRFNTGAIQVIATQP